MTLVTNGTERCGPAPSISSNAVRTLRSRLVTAFLLATLLPFGATIWVTRELLERSLGYATTDSLDHLSRTLESTMRELYQRERDALKHDADAGTATPAVFDDSHRAEWPATVHSFWESNEQERFALGGENGEWLELYQRDHSGVHRFTRDLHGLRMNDLSNEYRQARAVVSASSERDLHRGFTLTLLVLLTGVWIVSLVPLVFVADRISRPVRTLTQGLATFADDERPMTLPVGADDEVGRAVRAFNRMSGQLHQSRARLVHLTQMASWQSLARKTAHELKNSLTPIRLTVEEMFARVPEGTDRHFVSQAVQIVVDEVETLERRVRAFSEFATEPPVHLEPIDLNTLVSERVALLMRAHPSVQVDMQLDRSDPRVLADRDLLKGTLTNLIQNAAEAVGGTGQTMMTTRTEGRQVIFEVHDSGPGLAAGAGDTLFEPTITFKKHGMGLGLSIARRNALLCGGDLSLTTGALGGAAFRVTLLTA